MAEKSQPSANYSTWPVILALTIVSAPLVLMYAYLFIDTITDTAVGSLIPDTFTLRHWRFLWETPAGKPNIWLVFILPQVLAPGSKVQVLSVYLSALIADDNNFDFGTFKAVGVFYIIPVLIVYALFHKYLMNIYGGGSKG
jgi:inositol-phosphate transport system permease protein